MSTTEAKRGRPPIDPSAPVPPTLSIPQAARRYGIGKDQMRAAVERDQVASTRVVDRDRVITSAADRKFGLTPAPAK
jgi:hypothetical protein